MAVITSLLAPVARIARQAPTRTLSYAYLSAVREFCNKSRWLLSEFEPDPTTADAPEYDLTDFAPEQLEVIGIKWLKINDGSAWSYLREGVVDDQDLAGTVALPELYEYRPHALFGLNPTPDAAYDLKVNAVVQPTRIATEIPDRLLPDWQDGFEAGALYRLLRIKGQPWYDPQESGVQYKLFMGFVDRAAAAAAAGNNPGAYVAPGTLGPPNARLRGRILAI